MFAAGFNQSSFLTMHTAYQFRSSKLMSPFGSTHSVFRCSFFSEAFWIFVVFACGKPFFCFFLRSLRERYGDEKKEPAGIIIALDFLRPNFLVELAILPRSSISTDRHEDSFKNIICPQLKNLPHMFIICPHLAYLRIPKRWQNIYNYI